MNNRSIGTRYEEQAVKYLEKHGFLLLEQNFRCRLGEIDIVGIHEGCLVFAEVKYRNNLRSGWPEEAVGCAKQLKISSASDYYRLTHKQEANRQVRYDVVAICGENITWHQNAFPYSGKNKRLSW